MHICIPGLQNEQKHLIVFYITNIIFLAFGAASLVVGLWLYLSRNDFIELTPASYSALSAAGLCVFTGTSIFIISLIGFFAVGWRNKYLLYSFVAFVALLIFIHGATRITGLFHNENAKEHLRLDLLRNINTTHVVTKIGKQIQLKFTWDHLQSELKCCGVDSLSDWFYSVQWPSNKFVPDSCCDTEKHFNDDDHSIENCGKMADQPEIFYQDGCHKKFSEYLSHHVILVNWVTSLLLIAEIAVLTASVVVILQTRKNEHGKNLRNNRRQQIDIANEELRMHELDRIGDANPDFEASDMVSMNSR
ncbi:unnamed protein product [Caenorhabditis angaria]|uniref:Tetraspanin n=1 Tax=Caenorhabditis angaria TaxID=860376 RepID=A0A9P1J251_9PELO|nr:unnamed protein product [Caenorhabditis angaria]